MVRVRPKYSLTLGESGGKVTIGGDYSDDTYGRDGGAACDADAYDLTHACPLQLLPGTRGDDDV